MTGKLDNKSTSYAEKNESKGLISVFARHPTASNLLIVIMLLAGLVGAWRMNTQFFPNFGLDIIVVNVKWNGAKLLPVGMKVGFLKMPYGGKLSKIFH